MTIYVCRMVDASKPPAPGTLPPNTKVVAGYLGGYTPHVWTQYDWNKYNYKKLPIWVHKPGDSGIAEGWAALQRAYQLKIPKGTLIVIDVENNPDPQAVANFRSVANWGGYYCGSYGSASTVFENPEDYGWWVADWNDKAKLYPRKGVFATQYINGDGYDLSVIRLATYYLRLRNW